MICTIAVLPRHIRAGVRADPEHCPVSRAITEVLGEQVHVVGPVVIVPALQKVLRLPDDLQRWITDYDCRRGVAPIKFRLDTDDEHPDWSIRRKTVRERGHHVCVVGD